MSLRRLFSKVKADARRADYTAEPAATLAVRHRLHWDEGAILWAIDDSAADEGAFAPLALQARQPLLFEIVPPVDALGTLFVKVGTYRRTNVGTLRCSLRRPSSMALALGEIDLSNLEDNAFAAVLDLRGVAFEAGRPCWVELELDAEPGNEIALYHAAAGETHPAGRRQLRGFDPEAEIPADEPVRGLLPNHRLDWAARDAFWSTWPSGASEPPGPHELEQRRPFEFDIVAPAPRIDTLSMQFGTYNRRSRSHIALELLGPEGEILHREGFDLAELVDNAFAPVAHLSQIALKPGRKYRARLHWLGPEGEGVALYAAPVRAGRYEFRPHLERLDPERVFAARTWAKAERATDRAFLILDPSGADRPGAALDQVRMVFPGLRCSVLNFEEARAHLDALRAADLVVFVDMYHQQTRDGLKYDDLCFDLHRNRVCTIFLAASTATTPPAGTVLSPALRSAAGFRRGHARRCHYVVSSSADAAAAEATWPGGPAPVRVDGGLSSDGVASLVGEVRRRSRPRVGIVSVLHRKADIIEMFLEHVRDQTYPGPITTVLVDDLSPDDDAACASAFGERLRDAGRDNRSVVVLRNAGNLGNCASRLAGLAAHDADIYIIIDCDCLMNRDFVAAHIFEHWWDDVDAVLGPVTESRDRDPRALLSTLEGDPAAVVGEARPEVQDPVQGDAFVNSITRNFSIKRRDVTRAPLFDLDFSYSAKPGSGFGWEDVEMGCRLYRDGAVIRATTKAFVVHCSHPSSISDERKVEGSTRNFARLFRKHPHLPLEARRWATGTYDRIAWWQESLSVPSGPERGDLDALFTDSRQRLGHLLPLLRGGRRKLRVLTYRWHAAHQYELYKLPHDFTLVTGLGAPATDVWSYDQRPLRPNARLVPFGDIDPRDFDVVLLHFDENVMAAHLCNGIIPASWGDAFRRLLDLPGLPKIAVCHGTVPFVGQFGVDPDRKAVFEPHEEERRVLVDALSAVGARVVCNSHQALAEWGFENARVIWHGFDPQEFPRGTLERDVLALQADFARPHYRGAWEFTQATSLLAPGIRVETAAHPGAPIENRSQNPYAVRNFRSYVDRIRQFKFYLNTTLRSPMPRARGEAMMTGVIPVCLRNHDVDLFIENGVDGFYSDRPEELAEFINAAWQDSGRLAAMSAAARRKALDVFNHDRYLAEWDKLLRDVA